MYFQICLSFYFCVWLFKKIHNKGKNACRLQCQRLNAYLERSLYPKDRLPVLLNFPSLPLLWKQKETRIVVWEAKVGTTQGRAHAASSDLLL